MEYHVPLWILCLLRRSDGVHDYSSSFHLWRLGFRTCRTRFSANSYKFHWWKLRCHRYVCSFHAYRFRFMLKDAYFKCGVPDYILLEPGHMHRDWNSTMECQISCLEIEIHMWCARYDAWESMSQSFIDSRSVIETPISMTGVLDYKHIKSCSMLVAWDSLHWNPDFLFEGLYLIQRAWRFHSWCVRFHAWRLILLHTWSSRFHAWKTRFHDLQSTCQLVTSNFRYDNPYFCGQAVYLEIKNPHMECHIPSLLVHVPYMNVIFHTQWERSHALGPYSI